MCNVNVRIVITLPYFHRRGHDKCHLRAERSNSVRFICKSAADRATRSASLLSRSVYRPRVFFTSNNIMSEEENEAEEEEEKKKGKIVTE